MRRARIARLGLALALAAAAGGCASLSGPGSLPAPDGALARCEGEVAARLRFLEPRLESHARYARRWLWAWTGIHAGGLVYGSTMAGVEDGRGERADQAVDAVKSAIGLAHDWIRPPSVRQGVAALRAIDTGSAGGCEERLAGAEGMLRRAVQDAHAERGVWAHLWNLTLNLAGALVVAEGFHEGSGWSSGALGLVLGEVAIWSYPWQAERTLDEYSRLFPSADLGPRWRKEARGGRRFLILE
jgi:hypothetical protein